MSRRKDPVTSETREFVLRRDSMCVARKLGYEHVCMDQWGRAHQSDDLDKLTLDHVHEGYGMAGKRAPSDEAHLVSLCARTHLLGWATRSRPALRDYLATFDRRAA